jgi:hypothetical protein
VDNAYWHELEDAFGLRRGTISKLDREESDWARVIKTHAIVEAALNLRLEEQLPDLADVVTKLPIDDSRYGKLRVLETLGELSPAEAGFIRALKDLRNRLVHDVTYLDFSLDEESSRWPVTRQQFLDIVTEHWIASLGKPLSQEWREWEQADIRQLLFAASFRFLYDTHGQVIRRRWVRGEAVQRPRRDA